VKDCDLPPPGTISHGCRTQTRVLARSLIHAVSGRPSPTRCMSGFPLKAPTPNRRATTSAARHRNAAQAATDRLDPGHFAPEADVPARVEGSLDPLQKRSPSRDPEAADDPARDRRAVGGLQRRRDDRRQARPRRTGSRRSFSRRVWRSTASSPRSYASTARRAKRGTCCSRNVYGWFVRGRARLVLAAARRYRGDGAGLAPALTFQRARVAAFAAR
jgi:hypothetical protein